jgi:ABC-type branched-subunit amino acid transport system ATPase component
MTGEAPPVVSLEQVSKSFGGIRAVRDLTMQVRAGEILGLIGPNGAGKSTVLGLVAGQQPVSAGRILLRGRRIDRLPQWRRVRAGVAYVPQHAANLNRASVYENVLLGMGARAGERCAEVCLDILAEVGLAARAREPVSALSHWEKRLLSLARSLAANPTVTLFDEPLAGLSAGETEQFIALIRRLRDERNKTFVVTEHNVDAVLRLCDRIVALHMGEQIGCDVPERIVKNARVVEVYLGGPS